MYKPDGLSSLLSNLTEWSSGINSKPALVVDASLSVRFLSEPSFRVIYAGLLACSEGLLIKIFSFCRKRRSL